MGQQPEEKNEGSTAWFWLIFLLACLFALFGRRMGGNDLSNREDWEPPGKGLLGDLPPEIRKRAEAGDGQAVADYDSMRLRHFMMGEVLKNRKPLLENPGQ
jgi:hypothetical protein